MYCGTMSTQGVDLASHPIKPYGITIPVVSIIKFVLMNTQISDSYVFTYVSVTCILAIPVRYQYAFIQQIFHSKLPMQAIH